MKTKHTIRSHVAMRAIAGVLGLVCIFISVAQSAEGRRAFTVGDEVELTLFGDPNGGSPQVRFSPNENYVAVWSERGDLRRNLVQDSLRIYRTTDIAQFLRNQSLFHFLPPLWVVTRSGRQGPVISGFNWLHDSSGVAFLEASSDCRNNRLIVADLAKRKLEVLALNQSIQTFDVSDRRHYVYSASVVQRSQKPDPMHRAVEVIGTGRSLSELLFPDDPSYSAAANSKEEALWAVVDGKTFEVNANGVPVSPEGELALSPNGQFLVTRLKVPRVPASWESLYPPPYFPSPYTHIHAGSTDVVQYVLIDLRKGRARSLTDAPDSDSAGWWVYGADPVWSEDGNEVLLPGTFLKSNEGIPSRPCVALVDLPSQSRVCVETLKGHTRNGGYEAGYHGIHSAQFEGRNKNRIRIISHTDGDLSSLSTAEYQLTATGIWRLISETRGEHQSGRDRLEVKVDQRFDKPPLLVGSDEFGSRTIWDPNPQLRNIDVGQASSYTWKDKGDHEWTAGLFKPGNYIRGHRYPLVIQTHGFAEQEFRPSGAFTTAMAARALAAAGIVVVQLGDTCPSQTLDEVPCVASGYETAAKQLIASGLVDPEKIGIIGFSRTDFYVMHALAFGSLQIKAACIADGIIGDYLEYLVTMDGLAEEYKLMIGAPPFGSGLLQWLKRSPGFNLDRVSAPLLIFAHGRSHVLTMWEPYAALRLLHKPVDLIMLNTDEHVVTNPVERLASQGGSVDWFRFWLQGYEDSNPNKGAQYVRWRKLREMQMEHDTK